jgi:hypothetical protein
MIRQAVWATFGLLDLFGTPAKPIEVRKYDTIPIPLVSVEPKKKRRPRKRHICHWTDQEVWGAVIAALLLGIFIGICI